MLLSENGYLIRIFLPLDVTLRCEDGVWLARGCNDGTPKHQDVEGRYQDIFLHVVTQLLDANYSKGECCMERATFGCAENCYTRVVGSANAQALVLRAWRIGKRWRRRPPGFGRRHLTMLPSRGLRPSHFAPLTSRQSTAIHSNASRKVRLPLARFARIVTPCLVTSAWCMLVAWRGATPTMY